MSHARPTLIGGLFQFPKHVLSISHQNLLARPPRLQTLPQLPTYSVPSLLLLTPRCLILSFFLVAAPSMTSSPSPFSRGRLLHFPALPSANENMGYSITCLIFSPCCHSICLALRLHVYNTTPVFFSFHKHELGCKEMSALKTMC